MAKKENEQISLGEYLKSLRQASGSTLRAIEKQIGVSSAFLSQLESGKVKQPSPLVLYKLASVYGVSYDSLMERAGYPVAQPKQNLDSDEGLFHRLGPLTESEEDALIEYLSFLRMKSEKRRDKA